ncbi:hypothetical protein SLEP1_g44253 [Rubroshorea leprosula]|uniref:Uncharacterized protein n=1 Tax=Rubroshorea leprosula TaxID=152421 RepID=A0AAV5LFL4_9ROSI|nr:hypothetical protein SLEP1_g44253 [Rubroshorea leprosula]
MKRMGKKVERKRRELKRSKKSMKKNEAELRRIQEQFEKVRKAIRQVHQNNSFTDAFVEINLHIFEAEHAGNFLAARQHADTLRLVFIISFLNMVGSELIRSLSYFILLINL